MERPEDIDFAVAEMGPRMQALAPKHRKFVWHYVLNGGNAAQAARDTGFSDTNGCARIWGCRLLQREDVLWATEEVGKRTFRTLLVPAVTAMRALISRPDHPDHAKAVQSVLSRLGFGERAGLDVRVEGEVTVNHTDAALEQLRVFRDLGVPRAKLEELFGFSGLSRYERMLEEQERKAPKLIEGEVAK